MKRGKTRSRYSIVVRFVDRHTPVDKTDDLNIAHMLPIRNIAPGNVLRQELKLYRRFKHLETSDRRVITQLVAWMYVIRKTRNETPSHRPPRNRSRRRQHTQ